MSQPLPARKTVTRPAEESSVAWFVELERARIAGDFARAAEAQRRLEGLGVTVRYQPATQTRKAVRA